MQNQVAEFHTKLKSALGPAFAGYEELDKAIADFHEAIATQADDNVEALASIIAASNGKLEESIKATDALIEHLEESIPSIKPIDQHQHDIFDVASAWARATTNVMNQGHVRTLEHLREVMQFTLLYGRRFEEELRQRAHREGDSKNVKELTLGVSHFNREVQSRFPEVMERQKAA